MTPLQTADSAHRVPEHTSDRINERIRRATRASILYHSQHPDQIDERLREIDEEWDVERTLETNAATLILAGTLLSAFDRKWAILPLAVSGFLLQHGLQGWCPPLPLLRRAGVRTPREIEAERYALKAMRGDFDDVKNGSGEGDADAAATATGRLDFNGQHAARA